MNQFLIRTMESVLRESESIDNFNSIIGDNIEIATEGIFDFLFKPKEDDNEMSWVDQIFGGPKNLLGRMSKYQNVSIKDGYIKIAGINFKRLNDRIVSYYSDESIINIFVKKYNPASYRRYTKKRIPKSAIVVDYLYTPEFFALELVKLFETLGKRYRDDTYRNIASMIYKYSWLQKADDAQTKVDFISLNNLQNISLELNEYQKEFIRNYDKLRSFLNLNGYILAFEQGLGKTLTAVGLYECLEKDRVYIVCPNTLKENWALEIKKYYQKYSEDEDLWKKSVYICDNPVFKFDPKTTKFIISNNESIKKILPFIIEGNNMLIVDESHNFRNLDSKRVNELLDLNKTLKCTDTLVMSGTPIKAAPSEIVPALSLIDPSFTEEAARIYSKAFNLNTSIGTSIVQSRFGKIMYRKEKDELKDLPNKYTKSITFNITNKNIYRVDYVKELVLNRFAEIYADELKNNSDYRDQFVNLIDQFSTSTDTEKSKYLNWVIKTVNTSRQMKMHDIDLEFVDAYLEKYVYPSVPKDTYDDVKRLESKFIHMENSCIARALGEILPKYRRDMYIKIYDENKEYFLNKIQTSLKKVIIFSQFKDVINHINDDLNASGIGSVKVTGDVVNKNRLNVFTRFKEDDMVQVLCATSQTVGTGVTLTEANQMYFFGPPWRKTDFDQCSDRIHRIGQTDDVYIYNVLLDTGADSNLSNRMEAILNWSHEMFSSAISKTEPGELDNKLYSDI